MFVTGNSYNRGRWSNAEYDEAVKAASSTNAGNEQARWDDFQKADKIILNEKGVIPVYQKAEGHTYVQQKSKVSFTMLQAHIGLQMDIVEE